MLLSTIISVGLAATLHAAPVMLNGAGSTFAEPIYSKWSAEYQKIDKDAQINYQGIGSGAGIKQMLAGTVDFAGTDDPMSKEDSEKAKTKVLHIPIALGAVVASYNLENTDGLVLSGPVLAKIFNGSITKWNDKEIAALNAKLQLPATDIVVITRSDSSGTTAVFSDYLAKVSPEWTGKNGKTVNWFKGSLGGKGNAGVTGLIRQTPGAVGYVELTYALENKLPYASMQNRAGKVIAPSITSVSNAADKVLNEALKNEFKISLTDSPAKDAYPIASFTWLLVYDKMPASKGKTLVAFAKWTQSDEAQEFAKALNYSPIPKSLRLHVVKAINGVKLEK